jgi:hypothetical protein
MATHRRGERRWKMSNIYGLPEPLVKALTVERRPVVPGRISVTALIDSPLRRILSIRHGHEIEEDVSENLWSLLGKAVHYVIEKSDKATEIKIESDNLGLGVTLVGVVDYYRDGRIIDWKLTSAWSAVFAADKNWELQLQTYGYLVQSLGHPVTDLSAYMILRDWNKREAQKNPDYPQIPFKEISYKLWEKSTVEAFISERVSLHLKAEKVCLQSTSIEIPPEFWCTPTERWEKPTKYAVRKPMQEKAVRVLDTEEAAKEIAKHETARTGKIHTIETRPGEQTKCQSYCSLVPWCPCIKELNGLPVTA